MFGFAVVVFVNRVEHFINEKLGVRRTTTKTVFHQIEFKKKETLKRSTMLNITDKRFKSQL